MSYTNLDILTVAFQKIGVVGETMAPSPEQGVTGLELANDLAADMATDGINLGWYPQTNLAATAPLQAGDVNPFKLVLARSLAAHYGITLTPELAAEIDMAYTRLVKRTRPYEEANLSELPRASGPFGYGGGFW